MTLSRVAISDLQNDTTRFSVGEILRSIRYCNQLKIMYRKLLLSNVVKQVIWRLKKVKQKMYRLGFLHPIKNLNGGISTCNFGDVFAMDFPGFIIRTTAC